MRVGIVAALFALHAPFLAAPAAGGGTSSRRSASGPPYACTRTARISQWLSCGSQVAIGGNTMMRAMSSSTQAMNGMPAR